MKKQILLPDGTVWKPTLVTLTTVTELQAWFDGVRARCAPVGGHAKTPIHDIVPTLVSEVITHCQDLTVYTVPPEAEHGPYGSSLKCRSRRDGTWLAFRYRKGGIVLRYRASHKLIAVFTNETPVDAVKAVFATLNPAAA